MFHVRSSAAEHIQYTYVPTTETVLQHTPGQLLYCATAVLLL
jgi:hypothetical protein